MELPAAAGTADIAPRTRAVAHATAIAAAAGVIGLLSQFLFYRQGIGLNFPLAVVALLAAAWFVPERPIRIPATTDVWLPLAAVALSAFVALRDDPTLVALDLLGSVTLATLAIASFGGMTVVTRPFLAIVTLGARTAVAALAGAAVVGQAVRQRLPLVGARERIRPMSGVVRGLLLAVPLVLLFLVLFSSADAVFGSLLGKLPALNLDLGSLPGRAILAIVAAWLAAGLLTFASIGRENDRLDVDRPVRRWLGLTEALTVLVVLDLLFAVFVVVQATYLFGGQDTLGQTGLTYAEYARRGFFDLIQQYDTIRSATQTISQLAAALGIFITGWRTDQTSNCV